MHFSSKLCFFQSNFWHTNSLIPRAKIDCAVLIQNYKCTIQRYTRTQIHKYMHTQIHIYTHTKKPAHWSAHNHKYMCTQMHNTKIHVYTNTQIHAYSNTYMYTYKKKQVFSCFTFYLFRIGKSEKISSMSRKFVA